MAVDEIKTSRDKVTRLLEYQSMFEDGLIYFNPDLTSDLVEELLVFPN
jgi:predicted phage terminase large subunit-like protein